MHRVRPGAYNEGMPGRNIVKIYGAEQFYHIYSRGVAKQDIFKDKHDYLFYISLLKRYLSDKPAKSRRHGEYPHFGKRLDLLAYCLMPNHIHLLIYQKDPTAMAEFMKSLMTSYGMYFNRRNNRVGPVFQSRYRASNIASENYMQHISRYIHLNPSDWEHYPYSSLRYYSLNASGEWIKPNFVIQLFKKSSDYKNFLKDYKDHKAMLEEIKWELADNLD